MIEMGAEGFFTSKIFAVVGASREKNKVGHAIFKNLISNKHILALPVNPNAVEILGKKCYKDLFEIPYNIDCVVIAVKAEIVPEVMKQVARRKIKNAIIISSGFSEAGKTKLEEEVRKIAADGGISVLGPNAFGFVDCYKEVNTTFFEGIPQKGGIAFISQSGALGAGVLDMALKEKIGMSGFVSLGISMNSDFSDFIEYFSRDRNTKVIALYMESLKEARGRRFIETCLACKKPVLVLKSGKTGSGERATKSHTSALASERGVYESIFKQAGLTEVLSIRELFKTAQAFEKVGRIGKRAAIITNAGGLGVLASDALERNGIEVTQLSEKIIEKFNKILPPGWSHNNPIDLIGDALADRYWNVLSRLDAESWFDFFVVLLTPQNMTECEKTAELLAHLKRPVFAIFYGGEKVDSAKRFLESNNILVFDDAEDLGRVAGKIAA